jgi:serine/threonine-protein kinase
LIPRRASFIISPDAARDMSLGKRLLTLFRLFLLFTVLVVVALISAITTIRLTVHGHQENMPNLVGRRLDVAQRVAGSLGIEMKVEGRIFNSKYAADTIVSQEPAVGTRIKEGQHAHLLVSLGAPRAAIPNLVGSSARAAQITAVQGGLSIGAVVQVHWPGTESDQVLAQDPPAASPELHSPAVNLLVSSGSGTPEYECPSFVGRALTDIRPVIDDYGFRIAEVSSVPRADTAVGTIVNQSPSPGTKINPGAAFKFEIAGPPLPPGQPGS